MWSSLTGRSPPSKSSATTSLSLLSAVSSIPSAVPSSAFLRRTTELPAAVAPSQQSHSISSIISVLIGSRRTWAAPSAVSAPSPSEEASVVRAPHVVVLLDGDGDRFRDGLLDGNYDGGRLAAIEVHDRAAEWLRRKVGPRVGVEVSVMLFWNVAGLKGHLARLNSKAYNLGAFSQGFSTSPFAAVAVDTGVTMQSADNALKAHLAIRLKIADYVLLGGCHDGGYADYLHQPGSTHSLNRIGLLKTSTVHSTKFESFGLEWVDWTDLFVRCSPLADSRYDVIKGVRVPRAHPNKTFAAAGTTEQTGVDPHSTLASLAPTSLTSTAPEQFQPLLAVLTSLREAGQHQPFQALVVEELRRRYHTFLYTRFDEYANDAERLGLVQLGRGAAEGTEWIRLRLPPSARSIRAPYLPLIKLLRKRSLRRPEGPGVLMGVLGERLGPHIYAQVGAFRLKEYVQGAELLGLVKLMAGKVGGDEWVILTC